jgi:hypothetical protein
VAWIRGNPLVAVGVVVAAIAAAVLGVVGFGGDEDPDRTSAASMAKAKPLSESVAVGVSPQTTLGARDYDKLEKAGTDVVRIPMKWWHVQSQAGDCEPSPAHGVCNWVNLDAEIGNAAEAGARVVPVLSDVPDYIYRETNKPPLNGVAREGWEDFVDAAVRRYGPDGEFWKTSYMNPPYEGEPHPIEEWQVWNEPNGKQFFHPKPSAKKYAYLVSLTSDVIRSVDPSAQVLLAGMFGTAEIPLREFLRDMYAVPGIEDDFDAIAVHPYAKNIREMELQINWARKEAKRAGDADVRMWITELGWGSAAGEHPLEKGERGQAKMLTKAFKALAKHHRDWNVDGVVWFTWQDRLDESVCQFCLSAGLFDYRGRSKRSYAAFNAVSGS